MKDLKKTTALMLAAAMLFTAASCGKTAEETEEETTAAETTVAETTAETTEETTAETTAEETEETEETEAEIDVEFAEFDLDEFPFEMNEDAFVEASNELGAAVYYDVDEFMSMINSIRAADSAAIAQYQTGITIPDGYYDSNERRQCQRAC